MMTRYVTDDLKIMTKKAIADVIAEDEDCFLRNLKYVLEHLKPVDIEIYAKFLFAKLVCVKETAVNDTQTDLRTIGELQAEINRLRKALEYYADESNYSHYSGNNEIICDENCGDVARKALNESEE